MQGTVNVLLLHGGSGSEAEISDLSSEFFYDILSKSKNINCIRRQISKNKNQLISKDQKESFFLTGGRLRTDNEITDIHYAIPCLHGHPGETGDIQSILEFYNIPFFGPDSVSSTICFNKVSTKLWLDALKIPNTPYLFIHDLSETSIKNVTDFFEKYNKDIYIKAASQGSSIGCYHVTKKEQIEKFLKKAFKFSNYILIEQTLKGRELEVATFDYLGKVIATNPGEILCPEGNYTYEQKYSSDSNTKTDVEAQNIPENIKKMIRDFAAKAFIGLKLKDLSRIDFFLTENNEIYLNEINTFPGHTKISMFPTMLENHGISYSEYLLEKIMKNRRS